MIRFRASSALRVVGAILAITSVAINVVLAVQLMDAFSELQMGRVFPLGDHPRPAGAAKPTGTAQITLYGDSRVKLWNTAALARLGSVSNLGRGGQTSGQLLLQLQTEIPRPATWGIVQIGINDIHPIGALPRYREAILGNLQHNLAEIVQLLLRRCDYVVVTTIVPPGRVPLERRLIWDPDTLAYVAEMNELIRSLARTNQRIRVLDASALLGSDNSHLQARYTDPDFFLHISPSGYAVLSDALVQILTTTTPVRH